MFLVLTVANTAGAVFRLALLTAYKNFKVRRNKAQEAQALKFLISILFILLARRGL